MKSLDQRNEKLISTVDWYAAARAAEDCIRFYHGDTRAVELVSLNPSHDLSSLDTSALTVIATRIAVNQPLAVASSSPVKWVALSEGSFQPPKK